MGKTFTPTPENVRFIKFKANGQNVALGNKSVKSAYKTICIVDKASAEQAIAKAWQNFLNLYDVQAEDMDAAFAAVSEMGKKKIQENGFGAQVTRAVENGNKVFRGETASETNDTNSEPAPANPAPANPAPANPAPANPAPANPAPANPAPANPAPANPAPANPAPANPAPANPAPANPAPKRKSRPADAGDSDEANSSEKKKSCGLPVIIAVIVTALLTSLIWWICINPGTAITSHHSAPIHVGNTDGVVVYSSEAFMILDSAKSSIKVERASDKTVGQRMTMLMSSTVYTDDDGRQFLRYTSSANDVYVEITAPIFAEGYNPTHTRLTWEESVAKRNRQFGTIEVMWNGDDATITLKSTGQTYYLTAE